MSVEGGEYDGSAPATIPVTQVSLTASVAERPISKGSTSSSTSSSLSGGSMRHRNVILQHERFSDDEDDSEQMEMTERQAESQDDGGKGKGKAGAPGPKQPSQVALKKAREYSASMLMMVRIFLVILVVVGLVGGSGMVSYSRQLGRSQPYLASQDTLAMYSKEGGVTLQLQVMRLEAPQLMYVGVILIIFGIFWACCLLNLYVSFPRKFYQYSLDMRLPLPTSISGGIILQLMMLVPLVDSFNLDRTLNATLICCGFAGCFFISVGNILRRFYGVPNGIDMEERLKAGCVLMLVASFFYLTGFFATLFINIYIIVAHQDWLANPDKALDAYVTVYVVLTSFINIVWGIIMILDHSQTRDRTLMMEALKLFFLSAALAIHCLFVTEVIDRPRVLDILSFPGA